jgi:hypothetical protein
MTTTHAPTEISHAIRDVLDRYSADNDETRAERALLGIVHTAQQTALEIGWSHMDVERRHGAPPRMGWRRVTRWADTTDAPDFSLIILNARRIP